MNTPPQYGAYGPNITLLHLRRSNMLPDLLSTTMASQLRSVSALINELNWLSLEKCRHHSRLLLYKILHNHATIPIIDLLPNMPTVTHTLSYHDTKLYIPTPWTDIFKYSYFPSVIRLWNNLPQYVIDSSTVTESKSLISNVLLIIT